MKTLNKNTKQAQNFIKSYNATKNKYPYLYSFYKSFSKNKIKAFDYCKKLETDLKGFNGGITGGNSDVFSYAFEFVDNNGVCCLCYITKCHDYKIEF